MKLLIFWDVYGRVWRKALSQELEKCKELHTPDFTIVNIENATSWRWPVSAHAQLIDELWADILSWGDHIYDNSPDIDSYISAPNTNLIIPANLYPHTNYPTGKGYDIFVKNNQRLLFVQLLWENFVRHNVYNPFIKIQEILEEISADEYDAIVVEFHRETTADLAMMAHFLDGKVAIVYGTHTHVQTNDAHILPNGTGMITDVGMNWPYNSIIWATAASVLPRCLSGIQKGKIEPQLTGEYQINALVAEIDNTSGMCTHIEPIFYTGNVI